MKYIAEYIVESFQCNHAMTLHIRTDLILLSLILTQTRKYTGLQLVSINPAKALAHNSMHIYIYR